MNMTAFLYSACVGIALLAAGAAAVSAQTGPVPPEPPAAANLATLGEWIARWLPVVGAFSYPAIEGTGDFLAHASDSITAAGLEGCTLVLRERSATTVHAATVERHRSVRVPLEQLDTSGVEPRIRRPGMLLGGPHVMVTGQLVIPLRSPTRTPFITVVSLDGAGADSLSAEHLVPLQFAMVPAVRSARAIRRAAAICLARPKHREERTPSDPPVYGY